MAKTIAKLEDLFFDRLAEMRNAESKLDPLPELIRTIEKRGASSA